MERLNIIGLMGNAKVGKSTSGAMMCAVGQGKQLAFADKLKEIVTEMFALHEDACYEDKAKEAPTEFECLTCPRCNSLRVDKMHINGTDMATCLLCSTTGEAGVFHSFWTPRMIMQHIGTEGFRAVYPKVWSSYAIRAAKKALASGAEFVVFTDARFKTECDAIWEVGGEVWRIKRPSTTGNVGLKGHASEVEQASIPDSALQAVIDNDGTLDDLKVRVTRQLHDFLQHRSIAA